MEALHESSGCAERTGETGILNDSQMTSYAKTGVLEQTIHHFSDADDADLFFRQKNKKTKERK